MSKSNPTLSHGAFELLGEIKHAAAGCTASLMMVPSHNYACEVYFPLTFHFEPKQNSPLAEMQGNYIAWGPAGFERLYVANPT